MMIVIFLPCTSEKVPQKIGPTTKPNPNQFEAVVLIPQLCTEEE
jgi:hypothetical protein